VSEPTSPPAGWFPDPLGRYEFRWFNGVAWTADVSMHGQRMVDPVPLQTAATHAGVVPGGAAPATSGLSRTMSVFALVAGLVGVITAWMPFLVALGAIAAVAAIVLGIITLRAVREGRALGRDAARAGLVLGVVAVCVVPVGVWLTGRTVDELQRFVEPGRHSIEITDCSADNVRKVSFTGTIQNLEDDQRDYSISIEVLVDGRSQGARRVAVDGVEAGATATFTGAIRVDRGEEVTCDVFDVTGPFPFGLEPAN
jgi:hypothetical protein